MRTLPHFANNHAIRLGHDMDFDAWFYNFMIENNFAHHMNPQIIASSEQIAFMVALEENEVYIPCTDGVFSQLMQSHVRGEKCPSALLDNYCRAWRIVMRLVRSFEPRKNERQRIMACCRQRFQHFMKNPIQTPHRLMKRMTSLVAAQTGIEDPWLARRREANKAAHELFMSALVQRALYAKPNDFQYDDLATMRTRLDTCEVARLLYLSAASRELLEATPSPLELDTLIENTDARPLMTLLGAEKDGSKTILFLPDTIGGFVFDMALLKRLTHMGHKIIVAAKSGFYFYCPTIGDMEDDPILEELLGEATIVHDTHISKNELLRVLRESRLIVIHDGTRERLNLYRTNVTFARAWKEADIILSKGIRNAELLVNASQHFTRDTVSYWLDEDGKYHIKAKARPRHVHKVSHASITERAENIISQMREAHKAGKTVMFYSCIIGSIPGQEATAIALVRCFVDALRNKLDDTFIINPAEQSADNMDGDDLMYMWERVQRSGYIHVWRFQTVQDIEDSFALLGRKVPPNWAGKDATFSTGCTKEMRIALDVQKRNTEMQIIGPSMEKFFRRDTYGVGKYFDARLPSV